MHKSQKCPDIKTYDAPDAFCFLLRIFRNTLFYLLIRSEQWRAHECMLGLGNSLVSNVQFQSDSPVFKLRQSP